jgi:PAS domain S-box-containing protein
MNEAGSNNLLHQLNFRESEMSRLIQSKDWSGTTFGALNDWPRNLLSSVASCLKSNYPMAIWWGDELTKIYNDAFGKLLLINHNDALGTKGTTGLGTFPNNLQASLEDVLRCGVSSEFELKVTLRENKEQEQCLIFNNTPIFLGPGSVGGVLSFVVEKEQIQGHDQQIEENEETLGQTAALEQKVSERTKLLEKRNEKLKMSEERYNKMTEEVEDYAIILLDENGTILNWNKGAEKIKGYSEAEIIGQNFSIFYLDEDRKTKLPGKLISEARGNGRAMHEGWRKRKDGSKFWGSIVITALHDKKNNIIGFTKVTRDLTERKLAEDTMKQHTAELEIKNKQLEQFAYIASHDLQEPLRKIQTFVHILEKRIDNPEARAQYFEKINSSAKRLAELIQSVLNYSRLSKNNELWTPTDLNVVFENVKSDYELMISEKNADVTSVHLPTITGIPLQLHQLFSNLIGNALKFSIRQPVISISSAKVDGEEVVKSIPQLGRSKNYLILTFKDNGIGFDQQYAERIFTIFQRLNRREDYAGTGIGLALCKRVVDNHEGFIRAEGVAGKGATFIVYLPVE